MNENEKEVFLNMMGLVSNYPKYIMMEKFLDGNSYTAVSFIRELDLRLPKRTVYETLWAWKKEGLLEMEVQKNAPCRHEYTLNPEKLMEKLS